MDPAKLDAVFRLPPALHRFPGNMAKRTREMCAYLVERYDGDASRIWRDAKDGADLYARLLDIPGSGPMKAGTLVAILGKRLGVRTGGLGAYVPDHMTLGDVDSSETLREYQTWKGARKAGAARSRGSLTRSWTDQVLEPRCRAAARSTSRRPAGRTGLPAGSRSSSTGSTADLDLRHPVTAQASVDRQPRGRSRT
jgi:hypothetical protein